MIKSISANARVSFKQPGTAFGDIFYTFEYGETREDDYDTQEKYEADKERLWQQVNNEVNKQVQATIEQYQPKRG